MSTTLKWGLITGMVYVVFELLKNLMGLQQGGGMMGMGMQFLILIITFFTIYLGVKESRDEDHGGQLTMGEGFKTGMQIVLIASILAGVYVLIYGLIIDPEYGDKIQDNLREQWDAQNMTEEQQDMALKWTGWMLNPLLMAPVTIAWVLFWGLIKSLVA